MARKKNNAQPPEDKPPGDNPPPDPAKEAEAKAKAEAEAAAKAAADKEAEARENAAFVKRSCELAQARRSAFTRMERDQMIYKESKQAYELAVQNEQAHKDRYSKPMPLFESQAAPAKASDAKAPAAAPEPEPGFKSPIDDRFKPTVLASIAAIEQPWLIALAKSPPDVLTIGDLVKHLESGARLSEIPEIGTDGAKTIFTAIAAAHQQFLKAQETSEGPKPTVDELALKFLSSLPTIEMPWVTALGNAPYNIQTVGDLEAWIRAGNHLGDIPEIGLQGGLVITEAIEKARKDFHPGQDAK